MTIELVATCERARSGTPNQMDNEMPDDLSALKLSRWSQSIAKRGFDIALVMAALPVAVPACILIGMFVCFGSPGPVFFVQTRKGLGGRLFSIVKFHCCE